jgi:hypothetical protein
MLRRVTESRKPQATSRKPRRAQPVVWPLVAVVAAFILSRVGYYVAGIRFDASSLPWFWQFIDPALLKANLGQSLWYLHSQPPAFNLFLGLILNVFPGHETTAFTACYLLLGLVFAVTLFLLLRGFGASDGLSAVLASVYIASPACVLYENWLFYTYPMTVLLLLAALFWQRFVSRGRFLDALGLFVAAAMLAMTWSLFHLVWLLVLVLALVLVRRRDWRTVLVAAAVPLLIVTLWYGKNLVQTGQFTGSTWFGINFSKMTNSMLTVPERRALYDNGTISAVSMVPPFSNPDKYVGKVGTVPGRQERPQSGTVPALPNGVPVLDQEMKPSNIPNFNNTLFIAVSRQYGRDALRILAARPAAYVRGLAESYLIYFLPASAYLFLADNAGHISAIDRFAGIALNGRFSYHSDRSLRQTEPARYYLQGLLNTGWFLILAYILVLAFGFLLLFRPSSFILHPSSFPSSRSSFLVLRSSFPVSRSSFILPPSSFFFILFSVAWVTLVANAVEVGENNRFRFVTDPLVFVLIAALVVNRLAQRRATANDK